MHKSLFFQNLPILGLMTSSRRLLHFVVWPSYFAWNKQINRKQRVSKQLTQTHGANNVRMLCSMCFLNSIVGIWTGSYFKARYPNMNVRNGRYQEIRSYLSPHKAISTIQVSRRGGDNQPYIYLFMCPHAESHSSLHLHIRARTVE
jgi:hypothetical protein